MATRCLDSQIGGWGGGGGKTEGRHILIIAMSEHYHRCEHQIAWTRAWRQGSGKLFLLLRLGRGIVRK